MDYYGTEQVDGIGGKITRFKMFDAPFEGGRDKLYGHEPIQHEIYDLLRRFAAVPLALAAYNAGSAPVAACMCVPPYPETRVFRAIAASVCATLPDRSQLVLIVKEQRMVFSAPETGYRCWQL